MFKSSIFCALCVAAAAAGAQTSPVQLKPSEQLANEAPPAAAAAAAGAPVGYVKTVTGVAFVVTLDQPVRANIGTPVLQGSVLKTGLDSSMGVTFKDSTMMSFGPETELKVDEYLYAPTEGKLKFASRLARGTLNYVSGVIAKLRPDAITVTTPSGMIGVRGTQFVAKVEPVATP